jgi:hypothetical protein
MASVRSFSYFLLLAQKKVTLPAGRQGLGKTLCLALCCELAFGKLFIRKKVEEPYILFFELSFGAVFAAFGSDHTFVACAANKAPF